MRVDASGVYIYMCVCVLRPCPESESLDDQRCRDHSERVLPTKYHHIPKCRGSFVPPAAILISNGIPEAHPLRADDTPVLGRRRHLTPSKRHDRNL